MQQMDDVFLRKRQRGTHICIRLPQRRPAHGTNRIYRHQGFHSCRFSKAGFQIPAPAKPAESLLSLLKSLLLLLKHLIFRRFQNYHFLIFYFEISGPELFKIIIFGLSHHFLDKTSPILV